VESQSHAERASDNRGPNLALSIAGCSLAAIAISGLIMYPFHERTWAGWAWVGLTMTLGPGFIVALDRLTR
jgi:hypothetical protein